MPNTTMNVSLPESLKEKAKTNARKKDFSGTSDYVQHLIRKDDERLEAQGTLKSFIQQGINSGEGKKFSRAELKQWMNDIIDQA